MQYRCGNTMICPERNMEAKQIQSNKGSGKKSIPVSNIYSLRVPALLQPFFQN